MRDILVALAVSVARSVTASYIVNVRLRLTPPVTYVPFAVRSAKPSKLGADRQWLNRDK